MQIGDKVWYHNEPYKILYIYDDGKLKLQSVRGKLNSIIYRVDTKYITLSKTQT